MRPTDAVSLGNLGGIGLDLEGRNPCTRRSAGLGAAAVLPSVIGGPGWDFIAVAYMI
jgi:hypothetical protein